MKKFIVLFAFVLYASAYGSALQALTQKCRDNHAKSCHDLGYLYDQKGKAKKAASLYKKACTLNHAMGCYRLAEMYLVGSGVPQSDASFIVYTQKSCRLGYEKSCSFAKKAQPKQKPKRTKNPKMAKKKWVPKPKPSQKAFKEINLSSSHVGTIKVKIAYLDAQKRTLHITAAITNQYREATGWLSFSFPGISQDILRKSKSQGFDHIRSYPEGASIFNITHQNAMDSRYLLIEGEAKAWKKDQTKALSITLKIPPEISYLPLYIRGVFKYKENTETIPQKGIIGQQGFANYKLVIPMGTAKQSSSATHVDLGNWHVKKTTIVSTSSLPQTLLSKQDKLQLLGLLPTLSYFHRERKAFEKQLEETLFGGAKYFTTIKSYRCKPYVNASKSLCKLVLEGRQSLEEKNGVRWEFHMEFTAQKRAGVVRISEIHSLDLLEE